MLHTVSVINNSSRIIFALKLYWPTEIPHTKYRSPILHICRCNIGRAISVTTWWLIFQNNLLKTDFKYIKRKQVFATFLTNFSFLHSLGGAELKQNPLKLTDIVPNYSIWKNF